jgi:hypothetical protein
MPKYTYAGDETLVFPTLGVVVSNGDQFDGPDGLTQQGLTIVGRGRGASAPADPAPADPAPSDSTTQGA